MSPNKLLQHICAALLVGAFIFSGLVTHDTSDCLSVSAGFAAAALLFYARTVQAHAQAGESLEYLRYPGLDWLSRAVSSPIMWAVAALTGLLTNWTVLGRIPDVPNRWLLLGVVVVVVPWLAVSHQRETRELDVRRSIVKDLLFAWAAQAGPDIKSARSKWVSSEEWLRGLSSCTADLGLSEAKLPYDVLEGLDWFVQAPRCVVQDARLRARFAATAVTPKSHSAVAL
ncbi:hypothetical protein AS149_12680 [Burkholderia cenocepacia]|nr:hypothetical protein AS149_12680 [Burkholderia cenocepacia]